MKRILEYVWIDGNNNLRSKIKVLTVTEEKDNLEQYPLWNFDGSSTNQATHIDSDIILKPERLYNNPFIKGGELLLCDCYNKDMTPHISNNRHQCFITSDKYNNFECLFGIEQEYVIFDRNNIPYEWKNESNPGLGDQGPYYCSVGGDRAFGRELSNQYLLYCLEAGINICGTNAEVMASQWEFQIGTVNMLTVSDDLIMARYILNRLSENYGCYVSYHPKPYYEKWNGSGGHTNISTKMMRKPDGIKYIYEACNKLALRHEEHIKVYGVDNEKRLSGKCETSSINEFTFGVANRGSSIRIPLQVFNDGFGYLEDRRPAANLDPYLVTEILMRTICEFTI